ncbi:MAG: glycosyltransferase [bacterium]
MLITIIQIAALFFNVLIVLYFFFVNFLYLFLLALAAGQLFYYKTTGRSGKWTDKKFAFLPKISILAPAYNEGLTITESISALLSIDYDDLEIIIINDGSRDETMEQLHDEFKLFPVERAVYKEIPSTTVKGIYKSALDERLLIIDKENGGKADSLNAGLNYARGQLYCGIDTDSLIEKDALSKLIHLYLQREAKIVALGGIVRIANDCVVREGEVIEAHLPKKTVAAFQVMEYIRSFLFGRTGWSSLNSLLVISGAFGLFERKTVIEAGGYRTDTVGEDMELVVRLHRLIREQKRKYKILYIPDPICWTQAPETLKMLGRQRSRWQRGLIETIFHHWKMIGNPRYGLAGAVGMTYNLLFEVLGPFIEVIGTFVILISYFLGWLNINFVMLFIALAILFGVFMSLFSLLLEEFSLKRHKNTGDIIKLFLFAVAENFGYRQLNVWWRFKAIFELGRKKQFWGEMGRKSFTIKEGAS